MKKKFNREMEKSFKEKRKREELTKDRFEEKEVEKLLETSIEAVKKLLPEEQKKFVRKLEATIEVLQGRFRIITKGEEISSENLPSHFEKLAKEIRLLQEKRKELEDIVPSEKRENQYIPPSSYYKKFK